jgi:hypothetical protein
MDSTFSSINNIGLNCLNPKIFDKIFLFRPIEYNYWWSAGLVAPHIGTIIGALVYSLAIGMHNTKDDSNASLSTLVTVPITKNDIIYERGQTSI